MHNKLAKFISPLHYLIGNKCPFDSTLYNNIHQLQHKKTKWFILKFLLATLNLSLQPPFKNWSREIPLSCGRWMCLVHPLGWRKEYLLMIQSIKCNPVPPAHGSKSRYRSLTRRVTRHIGIGVSVRYRAIRKIR